jgi:Flp pilus assembly pilin Flp
MEQVHNKQKISSLGDSALRGAALIEVALLIATIAIITIPSVRKFGIKVKAPFCAYANQDSFSPLFPPSYFFDEENDRCRSGTTQFGGGYYW